MHTGEQNSLDHSGMNMAAHPSSNIFDSTPSMELGKAPALDLAKSEPINVLMPPHSSNGSRLSAQKIAKHQISFSGNPSSGALDNVNNKSDKRYSGFTVMSDHTGHVTQGVTDEMQDSVHSLMPRMNYYEWKKDNVTIPEESNEY